MKTSVLIIEPSEIIVAGLVELLQQQTRFKVLEPENGVENIEIRLAKTKPDVVLINPTLAFNPKQLRETAGAPVVALCYQYVEQTRLRHFDAVVDIRDSRTTLADTLDEAAGKKGDIQPKESIGNTELTKREIAVLVLVAQGLMNKEIADRLNVSVYTVISHRKNIVQKTGIKSVAGLTVYAMMKNLIE